jgi:hypothetical protein
MNVANFFIWVTAGALILGLTAGFKLEKGAVQLTQTESVKAPTEEEKKKVPEAPASPTYKMDSFDNFMTSGPIQKSSARKKSER